MKSTLATTSAWLVASLAAHAQQSATASPGEKTSPTYQGCVAKLPHAEHYILATASQCILLTGDFKPAKVADHLAVFGGLLFEPTDSTPLTLKVDKTLEVKEICTQICKLQPPGSRGLHGKEKPGSEGGPPGVVAPSQPR